MILTVTLNPSVDKVFQVPNLSLGGINSISSEFSQAGGKGVNIAFMLGALGHEITAMGFAGNDPGGRFIQDSLHDAGITTAFTLLSGTTRTNYALVDAEAGTLTALRALGPEVSPSEIAMLRATFERLLGHAQMVVIAGSLPLGVEPTFCAEIVRLAASRGIRVAVNVREEILKPTLAARPFLAKPDLRDVTTYAGHDLTQREGRLALARHVAQSAEIAVVHASREILCVAGDEVISAEIHAHGLFGRMRLGDALVAGTIDAAMADKPLIDIAREGVAAALAAAASPKGQFTSRDDIQSYLSRVEVVENA